LISLLKSKKAFFGIFLGFFLFEAVSSLWTGHPYDMDIWFNTGKWLSQGVNIYLPPNHIGYPPLWAFWCYVSYWFFQFFGDNYVIWRFVLKIPLILANFGLAVFVGKFAEGRFGVNIGRRIFFVIIGWSFFIYISVLWGQINAISALLTFLAFWSVVNQKSLLGSVFLGFAITLKIYPLVVLPAFFVYILKNIGKKKVVSFLAFACGIPVLFTMFVFALFRWDLLYFLRTIFYSTPVFESDPLQFNVGNMNFWSFIALQGIDIASFWLIRQIWIVILAGGFFYWIRKRNFSVEDFVVSIISFYLLFMISYGWIAEQTFLDPLPFIFLLIFAYRPKRNYIYFVGGIQFLIYLFSVANQNLFVFRPLLESFSPSLLRGLENFHFNNGPLIWTIRGSLGLVISLSLIGFLVILLKPEYLEILQERIQNIKNILIKQKKNSIEN